GRRRVRPEAAAVRDESVVEGDERVEHDGAVAGDPPGRGEVEVTGVADDHGVEVLVGPAEESCLREREPGRCSRAGSPFLCRAFPDGDVTLDHLDTDAPKRR